MAVHVIANVNARGLAQKPERVASLERLCRTRAVLHLTSHVSELDALLRSIVADAPRCIVFAGGDGTFMSGTTALVRALDGGPPPVLGLLTLGTVGTTARNFSERGAPEALLDRWLDAFTRDEAAETAVRVVNRATVRVSAESSAGRDVRFGFIFGTGLVARFFEVYEARGARGIPLAGRIVAQIFAESIVGGPLAKRVLTPMPLTLTVDGKPHPSKGFSLLCASVVRDLGLGMKVNYRAGERSDRLHLVASSLDPRHLGPRMPFVMMGRTIGGRGHVDQLVSEFTVEFPGDDGPYVFDGDIFRAKRVVVGPGPVLPIIGPRREPTRRRDRLS